MATETEKPQDAQAKAYANLLQEYELEDAGFDDEIDIIPQSKPKAEAKPTPEPTEAKPAAPEPKKHPASMVRLAEDLGVSKEEIDSLDTEVLGERVYQMTRNLRAAPQQQATAPPPAKQPEPEEEEIDLELDPEEYDEGLIKAMKKVSSVATKQIKELKAKLEAAEAEKAQQYQASLYEQIDNAFVSLGMDTVFGKAKRHELKPGSAEMVRRQAVLASLQASPIQGKSPAEAIAIRAKELFGSAQAPAPEQKAEGAKSTTPSYTREQWNSAGLAKPTDRQTPNEPKGVKRATRAVAEKMREQGFEADDYLSTEEAGLPD